MHLPKGQGVSNVGGTLPTYQPSQQFIVTLEKFTNGEKERERERERENKLEREGKKGRPREWLVNILFTQTGSVRRGVECERTANSL